MYLHQKLRLKQAEQALTSVFVIKFFVRIISEIMIESHLQEGRQDIVPGQPLKHGVSVTDACISFSQTVPVLDGLAAAVKARRTLP